MRMHSNTYTAHQALTHAAHGPSALRMGATFAQPAPTRHATRPSLLARMLRALGARHA